MSARSDARLGSADGLMRARRFGEAIEVLDGYLGENPDDLRGLLRSGICHLLNRSERTFLAIYERAAGIVARLGALPGDVARLWSTYQNLFRKVSAAALLIGSTAIAGCGDENSAHRYSGGVYKPPTQTEPKDEQKPEADKPEPKPQPKPQPLYTGHKYSGGVFVPPKPDEKKVQPPAAEEEKDEQKPVSSHRYSGGVYLPPRGDGETPG